MITSIAILTISGVVGHTPIRPGVKSIFRSKKIKKGKKVEKSNKKLGLRGVRCVQVSCSPETTIRLFRFEIFPGEYPRTPRQNHPYIISYTYIVSFQPVFVVKEYMQIIIRIIIPQSPQLYNISYSETEKRNLKEKKILQH